jgi:hypothetical protein
MGMEGIILGEVTQSTKELTQLCTHW